MTVGVVGSLWLCRKFRCVRLNCISFRLTFEFGEAALHASIIYAVCSGFDGSFRGESVPPQFRALAVADEVLRRLSELQA